MKKVILCALALAVLSGCGAAQTESPQETVDIEAVRAAAYREGYDAGYAEAQDKAKGDAARAENEINKRGVMLQEWKDAYYELLAASGLGGDISWDFVAVDIQASNGDPTVYVDTNSKYYHKEGCSELNNTPIAVHLSGVRATETEPCPVCEPVVWGETT